MSKKVKLNHHGYVLAHGRKLSNKKRKKNEVRHTHVDFIIQARESLTSSLGNRGEILKYEFLVHNNKRANEIKSHYTLLFILLRQAETVKDVLFTVA